MDKQLISEIIAGIIEIITLLGLTHSVKKHKKNKKQFHNDTIKIIEDKIKEIERKIK